MANRSGHQLNATRGAMIALCALATIVGAGSSGFAGKYFEEKEPGQQLAASESDAVVYIIRSTHMGALIHFWTFADEQLLGVTHGKCWNVARLPAGTHVLWAKAENVTAITLTVEAGKVYYIHQVVVPGFGRARTRLAPIDEAEGMKLLAKIDRQLVLTDEARSKGAEISAEHLELARKRAAAKEQDQ